MRTRSARYLLVLLAGALLLTAKVTTDYNKKVSFDNYKSYSWLDVKADPLWTDRIRDSVDKELTAKGWAKVPSGGDASIAAFASRKTQQRIETFYTGFGGGWYWRGFDDGTAVTTVEDVPVGTLVVDIFDTPTKKLIWRGVATEALSDKPEKNEKKLEKAVEEMFKNFPPKPKG
jgi:hypothetical protein